jgi:hypothetical protein
MPRFVRIGNEVIHIPSLANVSMGTTCLGAPFLCFYYHNQKNQTMSYGFGKWAACEADLIRVKTAMIEIEKVVGAIPLTEEKECPVYAPASVPVLEKAQGKTLVPVTPLAGKGVEA